MQIKKSLLLSLTLALSLIFISSISVFAAPSRSRITGTDYISTSVAVSQKWSSATSIILATVDNFPDALAGTSLGIQLYAPLLYTERDLIPISVLTEINRLHPKTVYLLGGTAVISQSIEDDLNTFGLTVVRLAGNNRYETAVKIGQQVMDNSPSTTAFLAVGDNFPDALVGGFFAGKNNAPILLTDTNSLSDVTKAALIKWNIQTVYILGGTEVISSEVSSQLKSMAISTIELGGADRYETALKIDTYFAPSSTDLILATGEDYHSALIGSIYGSITGLPVMLMDENMSIPVNSYLKTKNLTIIGNEISDTTISSLNNTTPTIVSNNPSMKYTPDQMTNLQGLAQLLPSSNVIMNEAGGFIYSVSEGTVMVLTSLSAPAYQVMYVTPTFIDTNNNYNGGVLDNKLSTICKATLYDTVNQAAADQILSEIQTFATYMDGKHASKIIPYANYTKTLDGKYQYNIIKNGNQFIVKWKEI